MSHTVIVSTQTPLLRFDRGGADQPGPGGPGLPPHRLSPGGVCRMVLPTIQELRAAGWIRKAHWYSLHPGAPERVELEGGGIALHHLQMRPEEMQAYGRSKEKLWADIHGLPHQPLVAEDFRQYAKYNARTADALLGHAGDLDVAYIHDFQLAQVGALLGLAAPCVLRWHVPWDHRRLPPYTRQFLMRVMEDFDSVIVSTRRDLQGLVDSGFKGRVRQLYPHIEPADFPAASASDVARLEAEWGIGPDDPLLLMVARMDSMKRHDLALQALAQVRRDFPDAKLVLVGNGSFSGKLGGHSGKGKAQLWREELEDLVRQLGLAANVRFAHWIPDGLLAAAYQRADLVLLTSDIEGFGLTPLEAWRYGKAPVISSGLGAAEVVTDGLNGRVFPAGDAQALARCVAEALGDRGAAERMGEAGRLTLPAFTARNAVPKVREVLEEAMAGFHAVA